MSEVLVSALLAGPCCVPFCVLAQLGNGADVALTGYCKPMTSVLFCESKQVFTPLSPTVFTWILYMQYIKKSTSLSWHSLFSISFACMSIMSKDISGLLTPKSGENHIWGALKDAPPLQYNLMYIWKNTSVQWEMTSRFDYRHRPHQSQFHDPN